MEDVKIPTHLGIIMDGNRRWAKAKGKETIKGHLAGANRIISLAKYVFKKGIKYLSIYAFSTENFNRSEEEVNYLMNLIVKFFNDRAQELNKENIKVVFSGRQKPLSDKILNVMDKVIDLTRNNTGGIINICLNYGSRLEIVDAVKNIIKDKVEVNEENFQKYLYQDLPNLDLIIRTSGEQRLSNFMLWQASYAELYFPKTFFPDFDENELDKALDEYNSRNRRFGGN